MSEWRSFRLEELASKQPASMSTGPFGSAVSARNFRFDGVPMLRGSNLSEDVGVRLNENDLVFLAPELASTFSRSTVRRGDLVFTSWGSVGQIGLIDATTRHAEFVVSNKQMKFTPDRNEINSLFLYYYLSQHSMIDLVKGAAIGSTIPGFNLGQLKGLPVRAPSLTTQESIAGVLGALDDKIAANTKLIASSDALARLTYQASLDLTGSVPLSQTAEFVNGKAFTKGASGTGRVVIRIAELNSGVGGSTVFSDADVAAQHVAEPGDILFAWSGSLALHRWYRPAGIINQHIFKVIPRTGFPSWLAYQLVDAKLDYFKATAADKATTMGHIQRHHLDELVRVPSKEAMMHIDNVMGGLWKAALTAEQENLLLAELRDTLLPQLMSGKLRVRDAERTVGEVL